MSRLAKAVGVASIALAASAFSSGAANACQSSGARTSAPTKCDLDNASVQMMPKGAMTRDGTVIRGTRYGDLICNRYGGPGGARDCTQVSAVVNAQKADRAARQAPVRGVSFEAPVRSNAVRVRAPQPRTCLCGGGD